MKKFSRIASVASMTIVAMMLGKRAATSAMNLIKASGGTASGAAFVIGSKAYSAIP